MVCRIGGYPAYEIEDTASGVKNLRIAYSKISFQKAIPTIRKAKI